jgi:integrase
VKEPIRSITLSDGTVRYRLVVDIGRDENGRRQQLTRTFDTKREARAELSRIRHQRNEGTYVKPSKTTVSELLDSYLRAACFEKEENTKVSYRNALLPVRERLGTREAQSITRGDIEELRDWMLASGRRRGGKPGTGLSARSVRLTLGRLSAAFEMAVEDGQLARNPVRHVKPPKQTPRERVTWTEAEARTFLTVAKKDRLHVAWRLALFGPRRAEILGLRWHDIDLDAKTISIANTRVLVDGKVIVKPPKSRNSVRSLPLDNETVTAFRALHTRQAAEKLAAGTAYENSGYVVVDALGRPVHPDWFSDEFARLARQAGVPSIRLHDGRHSCLSLLEKQGVPISIISKWAGHYDPSFTYSVYVHAEQEDLSSAASTLGKLYKIN